MNVFSGVTTGAAGVEFEWDLHLPAGDGPAPLVLVAHGFKGFRNWGFFPWLTGFLAANGLAALRFDMSHNGVGRGDASSDFTRLELFEANRVSHELADLGALLAEVRAGALPCSRRIDAHRIGLLGHSRGGAAVILAGRDQGVRSIATWASVATTAYSAEAVAAWRKDGHWDVLNGRTGQLMRVGAGAFEDVEPMRPEHDVERAVAGLGERLLLVHGEADASVPCAASRRLAELAGEGARLELIAGADHVMNCRHPFEGSTPELEHAARVTADWFSASL